jgi:hypothetical protein
MIHRNWNDPLVKDLPLIPEVIKAKADKDGLRLFSRHLGSRLPGRLRAGNISLSKI